MFKGTPLKHGIFRKPILSCHQRFKDVKTDIVEH